MKTLLLSIFLLAAVDAAPNVIADYRIRNPDITPALGRGYSLTSYDVLSTCLQFDERTEPTYNYDYQMLETNSDGTHTSDVDASLQASVSYGFIKAELNVKVKAHRESTRHSHFVSTRMATERYYSSIDDTTASLTPDALALVQRGDLIGFFQACGSGYIRSIRRTAEVAAVFEFSSSSSTTAREMAADFKVKARGVSVGASFAASSKTTSSDSQTKITIKAFGLGLNGDGADTLVARSIEDYDAALKFAFKSMQNDGVGQIHGIEVVSWMKNLQFQNAVKFKPQQAIEWSKIDPNSPDSIVASDKSVHGPLRIRSAATYVVPGKPAEAEKPAHGKEGDSDYSPAVPAKPATGPATHPVMIESIEVKAITMINAEFITGLEAYYGKETVTVNKFLSCMGDLAALAAAGKGKKLLVDHSQFAMTSTASASTVTVEDAMKVVNAKHLNNRMNSLKNFVKHFYSKCASEISRYSNDGAMTKYWWDFPECMPSAGGSVAVGEISAACLQPGKDFKEPAKPGDPATCTDQVVSDGAYSDKFLDQYCMPEIEA